MRLTTVAAGRTTKMLIVQLRKYCEEHPDDTFDTALLPPDFDLPGSHNISA
ncbi:MAG: hypothetical protein IPG64_14105 [Haliea sp.]|nr:hypothetical protein [Haliea sp.]